MQIIAECSASAAPSLAPLVHINSSPNEKYLIQIGRITIEYNKLDYIFRIILKRIRKEDLQGNTMKMKSTITVVNEIKKEIYETNLSSEDKDKIIEYTKSFYENDNKNTIYEKRNSYIHALWRSSKDGEDFVQRIGTSEFLNPIPFNINELDVLIKEIVIMRDALNNLTQPLILK